MISTGKVKLAHVTSSCKFAHPYDIRGQILPDCPRRLLRKIVNHK